MERLTETILQEFKNGSEKKKGKRIVDTPAFFLIWAEDSYSTVAKKISAQEFAEKVIGIIEHISDGEQVIADFIWYVEQGMHPNIPEIDDPPRRAIYHLTEFIRDSDKRIITAS